MERYDPAPPLKTQIETEHDLELAAWKPLVHISSLLSKKGCLPHEDRPVRKFLVPAKSLKRRQEIVVLILPKLYGH